MQHPNLVITVPPDALAPLGARPSAGTVPTEKVYIFLGLDDSVKIYTHARPSVSVTSYGRHDITSLFVETFVQVYIK